MDWSDLGNVVKSVVGTGAPLIGGLLGGPAGAAVGNIIASVFGCENTPDAIHEAVKADPQAAVKLAEIEANAKVQLQQLAVTAAANELAADTAQIGAVNQTMQAESRSEHWLQWAWRPICGLTFCTMSMGCYFGLPLASVPVPVIPESVWMAYLAILGVASFWRGKSKAEQPLK